MVAAGYIQRHVLDVLTIVALKTLSNYVSHIAHTPLDSQFAAQAWSTKPATAALRYIRLGSFDDPSRLCDALTSPDPARQL